MKKFARTMAVTSAVSLLVASPVKGAGDAPLKFVNLTPAGVQFYVDGQSSCWAASGDYCVDSTNPGTHTFYSKWADPNYQPGTACDVTEVSVPEAGFTWTCGT